MSAYWAIIRDSFHEAFASRVLWVLLVLATLFLLAVLPVSINEKTGAFFQRQDIGEVDPLIATIVRQQRAETASPGKQVWKSLPSDTRKKFEKAVDAEDQDRFSHWEVRQTLLDAFNNRLLVDRDFYDESAWNHQRLPDEVADLVARDANQLAPSELARRNRLLLEAAYPDLIRPAKASDVYLGYLTYEMESPLPISKDLLINTALDLFTDTLLGVFGVFIAILVTASMIPKTFEPGAIDLLLSKPISRSLLFLTKFVGGCAFILWIGSYVITGLWFIAGVRFDFWNHRLLYCIPLLLFLFSIYYSVSALASVLWRNTIVSIVLTIVFWFGCWLVGVTKDGFEQFVLMSSRIDQLIPAETGFISRAGGGELQRWDAKAGDWQPIAMSGMSRQPRFGPRFVQRSPQSVGPVFDRSRKAILMAAPGHDQVGMGLGGSYLFIGKQTDDWEFHDGPDVPAGTRSIFVDHEGEILFAATDNLYRLQCKPEEKMRSGATMFGLRIKIPRWTVKAYQPVGPDDWRSPEVAAFDVSSRRLATYDRHQLRLLAANDQGKFAHQASTEVDAGSARAIVMTESLIALAVDDGKILLYDGATLQPRGSFQPFGKNQITQLAASPNGHWIAARFDHGRVWLLDVRQRTPIPTSFLVDQGDVSAIAFTDNSRIATASRVNCVTTYDITGAKIDASRRPRMDGLHWTYWHIVRPIYMVFPKPGKLGDLVTYVLTGKEVITQGDRGGPVSYKLDIWTPVWSNLLFLGAMLAVACFLIRRRDY